MRSPIKSGMTRKMSEIAASLALLAMTLLFLLCQGVFGLDGLDEFGGGDVGIDFGGGDVFVAEHFLDATEVGVVV